MQTKPVGAVINTWFGSKTIEEACKKLKLVDSMPARSEQVALNKGGHTRY